MIEAKDDLAAELRVSVKELETVLWRITRGFAYHHRSQPKKAGGTREIDAPEDSLKQLQRKILRTILSRSQPSAMAYGGVKGRSALKNAKRHAGYPRVFTTDIEDFFPSVGLGKVREVFRELGYGGDALEILIKATTLRYSLPQGAVTSTAIANLVLRNLDARFEGLALSQGFVAGRCVDDVTLSGGKRLDKFEGLARKIIKSEGYSVKEIKTKTMRAGNRQSVNNFVVNEKVNLPKEKLSEIALAVKMLGLATSDNEWRSVEGLVYWVRTVNRGKGEKLVREFKRKSAECRPL